MQAITRKPLRFVGSARQDLSTFPDEVCRDLGFALDEVQRGGKPRHAKILRGFGGAGVLELVENYHTDTYRAVYTVRFDDAVYVLHCFQKKSKSGIATPRPDQEIITQRLKIAQRMHEAQS